MKEVWTSGQQLLTTVEELGRDKRLQFAYYFSKYTKYVFLVKRVWFSSKYCSQYDPQSSFSYNNNPTAPTSRGKPILAIGECYGKFSVLSSERHHQTPVIMFENHIMQQKHIKRR